MLVEIFIYFFFNFCISVFSFSRSVIQDKRIVEAECIFKSKHNHRNNIIDVRQLWIEAAK